MSTQASPQPDADKSSAFWDLEEPIAELARMTAALRIVLWATFELDRSHDGDLVELLAPRVSVDAARQSIIGLERMAERLEQRWHSQS